MKTGALGRYRILDFTTGMLGYCGRLLADLGADVIKVEGPAGDPARRAPPFAECGEATSLLHCYVNANKRGVTLNVDRADDRAQLVELAKTADAAVHCFPHADSAEIERDLRAANRRLVITSITPFGRSGPRADWLGSDLIAWASSGLLSTIGDPDRPPVEPGGSLALTLAAVHAAGGTVLALLARRRSGAGQVVDISVQECLVACSSECGLPSFLDDGIERTRTGNQRQMQAPVGHFPTIDGAAAFVVSMPDHWDTLAAWIRDETGEEGVLDPMYRGGSVARVPYKEAVNYFVTQFSRRFPKQALFEQAQARGIPVAPVNTARDIASDPHLTVRGFWSTEELPGIGPTRFPGPPYRLQATPTTLRRPAPRLGEHNIDELINERRRLSDMEG